MLSVPTARQAAGLLLAILVLHLTVGIALQSWSTYPGLILTEIGLLLYPALRACRVWGLDPSATLGLRAPWMGQARAAGLGAGIGLVSFGMALGLTLPVVLILVICGGRYPGLPIPLSTPLEYVLAMLAGAVIAPFCEEVLFRGLVLSSLRRHGVHAAVWISAVAFGIFHVDPVRFFPTAALGVVYGYLTISSRSIAPAMAAHAINNGIALTLAYQSGGSASGEGIGYEELRREIVGAMGGSGAAVPPGDGTVILVLLVFAGALLLGGTLLAGAIAWIVRQVARSGGVVFEPPSEPARLLLGIGWVRGILLIALVVWTLGAWQIFAGAEPSPPVPAPAPEPASAHLHPRVFAPGIHE